MAKHHKADNGKTGNGNVAQVAENPATMDKEAVAAINEDFDEVGTFECHCTITIGDSTITHHLNTISYSIKQESNVSMFAFNETYTYMCNKPYVSGDSDKMIKTYLDAIQKLCLQSIGIMTVGSMQSVPNRKPLQILFNSRSNKTILNYGALPKGCHPKTVAGTKVTGLHGMKMLNQETLLENVGFLEVSPTQRIPSPIKATMFNNPDSVHNLILGMDVMQVLDININCSTWNGNQVPFRPSNYFDDATFIVITITDANALPWIQIAYNIALQVGANESNSNCTAAKAFNSQTAAGSCKSICQIQKTLSGQTSTLKGSLRSEKGIHS